MKKFFHAVVVGDDVGGVVGDVAVVLLSEKYTRCMQGVAGFVIVTNDWAT